MNTQQYLVDVYDPSLMSCWCSYLVNAATPKEAIEDVRLFRCDGNVEDYANRIKAGNVTVELANEQSDDNEDEEDYYENKYGETTFVDLT